jgi:3-oxoacyl-[acyl-carrier protein] reductase
MSSPESIKPPFLRENSLENRERLLSGKVALVTGGSRDIGAGITTVLALEGVQVLGSYREKERRISEVNLAIRRSGGRVVSAQADITIPQDREKLHNALEGSFGKRLDYLILNTSGNQQTARQVCVEANSVLVDEFLPNMNEDGRIVLMQSVAGHLAPQLRGLDKIPEFYEEIAAAKYEGEQRLRSRTKEIEEKGVSLVVVCPPEVEDTSNARLFRRQDSKMSEKQAEISEIFGIQSAVTTRDVGRKIAELLKRKDLLSGYVELFGNVLDARSIMSQWYGDNAILVDTLEIADENHGTGRMIVAKDYTRGHFNEKVGMEVLPGHIMIESAAQTLGLIALNGKVDDNSIPLFQEVNAKFLKSVRPGEGLKISAEVTERTRRGFTGNVEIVKINDEKVAEISGLKAMIVSKDIAMRLLER